MNDALKGRDTAENITIDELGQYLHKSIRPEVMPSTYAIIHMEFRRMAQDCDNARMLMGQLMDFFRVSHPHVFVKLQALSDGLFLPPGPAIKIPDAKSSSGNKVIDNSSSEVRDRIALLSPDRATRAAMATPTEEELQEAMHNAPTMIPPKPAGAGRAEMPTRVEGIPATMKPSGAVPEGTPGNSPGIIEINAQSVLPVDLQEVQTRSQMPTVSNEEVVNELVAHMKADNPLAGQEFIPPEEDAGVTGSAAAGESEISAGDDSDESEEEDPDFHSRKTLVNVPPDELVKRTVPADTGTADNIDKMTSNESESGVRNVGGDAVVASTPVDSGPERVTVVFPEDAPAVFNDEEEVWFKKGQAGVDPKGKLK